MLLRRLTHPTSKRSVENCERGIGKMRAIYRGEKREIHIVYWSRS